MSCNRTPSDDFFNATLNHTPANSASAPQTSNTSPPLQAEPQHKPEPETKTQPEQSRAIQKQAAVEKSKKKAPKIPWTSLEEKLLTECWIDVSEDPFRGTSQTANNFWGKVVANFNAQVEVVRTKNQITGKWRLIKNDVAKFNAIYNGYDKDRCSGKDDHQVMEAARKTFFSETRKAFNMYDCWVLLKDKPKFLAPTDVDVMGRSLAKRKTVVAVDDSDEEREYEDVNLVDNLSEHKLFGLDLFEQPSQSKTVRTSGSSDAASSRSSSASELQAQFGKIGSSRVELMETKRVVLEAIMEEEKKRTMFAAFQFLASGNPTKREQRFIEKAKSQVMNEYKQFVQLSDDDEDNDN